MEWGAEVTLAVTAVKPAYNKGEIRFSCVPVDGNTHLKTSVKDFYFISTHEDQIPGGLVITEGQIWTIKGDIGTEVKLSHNGNYKQNHHTIYRITNFKPILPVGNKAFVDFIEKDKEFQGIGPKKAKSLWKEFGVDIFNILKHKDLKKLTKKILSPKSAVSLIEGFKKYGNLKHAMWFTEKGIPGSIQRKIFKFDTSFEHDTRSYIEREEFSYDPREILEANPYLLITFGLAFKEADSIAKKHFKIEVKDQRRLQGAVAYALQKWSAEGHTVAERSDIFKPIMRLLGNSQLAAQALMNGYNKKDFILYFDTGVYQRTPLYVMENVVARRLLKLKHGAMFNDAKSQTCKQAFAELKFELEPLQREAVLTSIENAIACITGGAGTGKTTVLKTVLSAYEKLEYIIVPMALSGRAAQRMHDSINMDTFTIAKFLRNPPIEDTENKYLIVVDEASMLDLQTMSRIMMHIHDKVRILLCGDHNQLPPIGYGNILRDIVLSGVIPNTQLNIVRRQKGNTGIPEYSKNINEGVVPDNLTTGAITFHETDYDNVADVCIELYKHDPDLTQVVAATNQMVNAINTQCQCELNADAPQLIYEGIDGKLWGLLFKNDPVMFTQTIQDTNIRNGTLGKLISVEPIDGKFGVVKLDVTNEIVPLTSQLLFALTAGYGITLHKAQGSQFPRVIVALTRGKNLDRSWLYTAITRAETEIHIVGPREKMIEAIKEVSNASKRKTYLQHLLTTAFS